MYTPADLISFDEPTNHKGNITQAKKAANALPAYFGGKRKILERIFHGALPNEGTFVDPMSGSMSIPLAAKILGHDVIANDRSFGSFVIGKALIENEHHKIDLSLVPELITDIDSDNFVVSTFGDIHLPTQIARFSDNIYGHVQQMNSERWVYLLLLYRFLTFMAPYNLYRYPGLMKGFLNNTYPQSMQGHINKWIKNIEDPVPTLLKISNQINEAVFSGTGFVYQQDVFEFLEQAKGDILYLDPPYAGAGIPYERGYEVIEQMMERKQIVRENSVFNDLTQEHQMLLKLLKFGQKYEHVIFSYWTELHDRKWFGELFEEVGLSFDEIPLGSYNYSYSTKVGKKGEWTSKKDKGAKEILYVLIPK